MPCLPVSHSLSNIVMKGNVLQTFVTLVKCVTCTAELVQRAVLITFQSRFKI